MHIDILSDKKSSVNIGGHKVDISELVRDEGSEDVTDAFFDIAGVSRDEPMIYDSYGVSEFQVSQDSGFYTAKISDEGPDVSGSLFIIQDGMDTRDFIRKRGPVLYNHDSANVIGKLAPGRDALTLNDRKERFARFIFDDDDEFAVKIKGKVDRKFIRGTSVGIGIDEVKVESRGSGDGRRDVMLFTKSRLNEFSITAMPRNARALIRNSLDGDSNAILDSLNDSAVSILEDIHGKGRWACCSSEDDVMENIRALIFSISGMSKPIADDIFKFTGVTAPWESASGCEKWDSVLKEIDILGKGKAGSVLRVANLGKYSEVFDFVSEVFGHDNLDSSESLDRESAVKKVKYIVDVDRLRG